MSEATHRHHCDPHGGLGAWQRGEEGGAGRRGSAVGGAFARPQEADVPPTRNSCGHDQPQPCGRGRASAASYLAGVAGDGGWGRRRDRERGGGL